MNYTKACEEYVKNRALLHDYLYGLCKKYPNHYEKSFIYAKVCIIGRSYATGIERLMKSNEKQTGTIWKLMEHFYKNRKRIDAIFEKLSSIKEPLTIENLNIIIREHGRFVNLISRKIGSRSAPTFASKYMHFHHPSIPIYDSVAKKVLCGGEYKLRKEFKIFDKPSFADKEYYNFVCRFWQLYQNLKGNAKATGEKFNVKLVDNYLMRKAESKQKTRKSV